MELGRAIREIRKLKKITQAELSEKTGISQASISQIETCTKKPHESTLEKICEVFRLPVPVVYLMSFQPKDFSSRDQFIHKKLFITAREIFNYYFNKK